MAESQAAGQIDARSANEQTRENPVREGTAHVLAARSPRSEAACWPSGVQPEAVRIARCFSRSAHPPHDEHAGINPSWAGRDR